MIHLPTKLGDPLPNFILTHLFVFQVFRLLLAVLLVFTLFWLPIKVLILVVAFSPQNGNESFLQTTTFWIIYFAFHLLCMTTSFANPVLYSFLSKSFRVSIGTHTYAQLTSFRCHWQADFIDLFVCICTKLQVGQKSTNQLQRSNQPPTPQTFQHNNHFHYSSVRPINSHGNVINVANSRLASIKENKAEPIERIRLTEHRSHSSRASSSSVSNSGGSDTVRSNNSKNKSKHSRHSNNTSKQHSARSSVFDDF